MENNSNFTRAELDTIITSLEYTKRNFENCTQYPSYEFKCKQINEVQAIITKARQIRKLQKKTDEQYTNCT